MQDVRASHGIATNSELRSGLERCRRPAEDAHCLPPACYASEALVSAEADCIFRTGWVSVGRADRLKAAGDFATMDIAGTPIILVRDGESRLRAFANTCRHRGARLIEGDGNTRGFRCPFHSWAYRLDGRLAAAPHMDGAPGFAKSDHGLVEYRIGEALGFAFVALGEAPELADHLGDCDKLHAPWSLGRLVSVRRREFDVDCNWKTFLDVFNEYYHLPYVHPSSLNSLYDPPDAGETVAGAYASQFGETKGTGSLLESQQNQSLPMMPGLDGRAARGVRYTWVFPNLTFACGKDSIWMYETYPLGAGRCHVVQTLCFPPETMALPEFPERAGQYMIRADVAIEEDIPALVNQQRGLVSPDARQGRFSIPMEANVAAFANWYAGRMLG